MFENGAAEGSICPCCHRLMPDVERRRMNTSYVDEEMNYLVSCLDCFNLSEVEWDEMWKEYYGSRL